MWRDTKLKCGNSDNKPWASFRWTYLQKSLLLMEVGLGPNYQEEFYVLELTLYNPEKKKLAAYKYYFNSTW